MHIVDYFVIAGYFALVMYLGYYSMKKVSSFDDYAVAGRSMPLPIFFAAIAATLCGGGATIGRISFMHTTGIIVFFALTGVVINQIFSGLFISGRVHNAGKNVYSLGDLYGIYYGRSGRLLSSVFGFLFCVGAFGVQILAMGAILQTATGISLIPAALIASIVTLAYTWSGGHPRRNPHRRRAVRHHRHRGYALRLSRHRSPRRVRRHDVDPLLQPAL